MCGRRRWGNGGRGAYVDISAAPFTIAELVGLEIRVHPGFEHRRCGTDWSRICQSEQAQGYGAETSVAETGISEVSQLTAASYKLTPGATTRHRLAPAERDIKIDPPPDDLPSAPITRSPGLDVTNWDSSRQPAADGAPIKLAPHELARSIAIVPGTQHFALGGDDRLRMLDQLGQLAWPNEQLFRHGVARQHHQQSTAGRAVYQDGTVR